MYPTILKCCKKDKKKLFKLSGTHGSAEVRPIEVKPLNYRGVPMANELVQKQQIMQRMVKVVADGIRRGLVREALPLLESIGKKYSYLLADRERGLFPGAVYREIGAAYAGRRANTVSREEILCAALDLASQLASSSPDAAAVSGAVVSLAAVYAFHPLHERNLDLSDRPVSLRILPEGIYSQGQEYVQISRLIPLGSPHYVSTFSALAAIAEATESQLTREIVSLYMYTGGLLGFSSSDIRYYIPHAVEQVAELTAPVLVNLVRCALKLGMVGEAETLTSALIEKEDAAAQAAAKPAKGKR